MGVLDTVSNVRANTQSVLDDAATAASNAIVLTLSSAWLGIGLVKSSSTVGSIDRFDTSRLCTVCLDDFFLPLSQTYTLRAKKRLNVSSLVDGMDIIQQTRKEAKTIDCTLRITLRDNQPNLAILTSVEAEANRTERSSVLDSFFNPAGGAAKLFKKGSTEAIDSINNFQKFLRELYEKDLIFKVDNAFINDTFGVEYAFMTEYRFLPQVGKGTFNFEFSLTEVKYGENVLTFDANQLGSASSGELRQ